MLTGVWYDGEPGSPERQEGIESPSNHGEVKEMISVALAQLTADQQQAIALHYFEGRNRQEAAAAEGVYYQWAVAGLSRGPSDFQMPRKNPENEPDAYISRTECTITMPLRKVKSITKNEAYSCSVHGFCERFHNCDSPLSLRPGKPGPPM